MEDDTSSAQEWSIDSDSEHELQSICMYIGILSLTKKLCYSKDDRAMRAI